MAQRKYPIVLVCKESFKNSVLGLPFSEQTKELVVTKIVYNDTEYNSFIDQHKNDSNNIYGSFHDLSERKPTWEELKGNIFKRTYNWLPKWAIAGLASGATYSVSHVSEIRGFLKTFFHN